MKKLIFLAILTVIFSADAFAVNRAAAFSRGGGQRPDGTFYKVVDVYYDSTLLCNGLEVTITLDQTIAAINNSVQQAAMNCLNTDRPGTIANKNDVRLDGGFVS